MTVQSGSAQLPVGFGKDFVRKYINSQYDMTKFYSVVPKELAQNAVDAGSTNTSIHLVDKAIVCIDNGHGITPNVFKDGFVNLGASGKAIENAMGGFGTAKTSYLGNSAVIAIRSIAMVDGEYVESTLYGSWEDYLGSGLEYNYGPVGTLDLSCMPSIVKNTMLDLTGTVCYFEPDKELRASTYSFSSWVRQVQEYSVNQTGLTFVDDGSILDWPSDHDPKPLHVIENEGYTLTIYQANGNREGTSLLVNVCNNGRFQASQYDYLSNTVMLPSYLTVDVQAKVLPGERSYPWTSNREWISANAWQAVKNFISGTLYLSRKKQEANITEIALTTKALVLANGRVIDMRQNSDLSWVEKDMANDMISALGNTFNALYAMVKDHLIHPTKFGGLMTNQHTHGVSIDRDDYYSVYINPYINFSIFDGTVAEIVEKSANRFIATFLHEFAHSNVRAHDELFSQTFTSLVGNTPIANMLKEQKKLERALLKIVRGTDLLDEQRRAFMNSSGNINEAFKVSSID